MRNLILLLVHVDDNGLASLSTKWCALSDRGIRSHQTSIVDPQSLAATCAESSHPGSHDCWILFALDKAEEAPSFGDRVQAVDISEFSSRDGAVQVSVAVFTKA